MKTYLAIDIGASGGRHMLGRVVDGQIVTEEVYRFENGMVEKEGRLLWDAELLVREIIAGMKACHEAGQAPVSVAIDTWGVDYALLDAQGHVVGDTVAYRDSRTEGMDVKLEKTLSFEALYALTGIAKQPFNTLYQLMAEDPALLEKAERCLFLPEYFAYRLCGQMRGEYTIASTAALLNARTRDWDDEVFQAAGIPRRLFPRKPDMPGTRIGRLTDAVQKQVGFDCEVILPASHDTGSAFIAIPARDENAVYLSSGTWSLLGVELDEPIVTPDAIRAEFTNEGGYQGKIRFLKNIMGMWILQRIRAETGKVHSYDDMADRAQAVSERHAPYPGRFNVADNRLLAPDSMLDEVKSALADAGFAPPADLDELLYAVHMSLAEGYRTAIRDLEHITGKRFTSINIVGGGSQNVVLNQMTADALGLPVYAGPAEGTALGNLIAQMIALGTISSLQEARAMLRARADVKTYLPHLDK